MEAQTDGKTDLPGNELAVHIVQAVDGECAYHVSDLS